LLPLIEQATLFLGLMSGTSLDGVDAVCCKFEPEFRLLGHHYLPMPQALKIRLLQLQSPGNNELHESMLAACELAHWYADVTTELIQARQLQARDIRAIGCHGQTIRHRPAEGYTLQLNQAALLAELSGIDVIADFRSRDIAAGGQGAPLVPAFHQALLGNRTTHRVVVNIGGMANLSSLPLHGETIGFDCGPGNVLMDAWIHAQRQQPFDEDGAWAASGVVLPSLLEKLRSHPFFAATPPKSCGREEFNLEWVQQQLAGTERPADVQATLLELSAVAIAEAIQRFCRGSSEAYCAGGGARNKALIARLTALLPTHKVDTTASLGIPVDTVEAAAFAWLAKQFLDRQPGNLPAVTGARGPRILGALYPA